MAHSPSPGRMQSESGLSPYASATYPSTTFVMSSSAQVRTGSARLLSRRYFGRRSFARLPRRGDEERPDRPRATADAIADVRAFSLKERSFTTHAGGLFLLLPLLVRFDLTALVD